MHEANGDYAWMSSFLAGYKKVLEIGPGDGRGTLQLHRDGHAIVSVEENVTCLQATAALLESQGIQVAKELRGDIGINDAGVVNIRYKKVATTYQPGAIMLLEGDPLGDPTLAEWLRQNGPFDAIACWNIGTYALRLQGVGARQYRLMVQNKVYDLADAILRPGGILHIVDRSPIVPTQREDSFELHRQQAETTTLVPEQFDLREIDGAQVDGGVPLHPTLSGGRSLPEDSLLALNSMIVRKPGM